VEAHTWGGCTWSLSASSTLSRRKQRAVSQLDATTLLSEPCPLLWGGANLACPNSPVTAKHLRKHPAARARLQQQAGWIPRIRLQVGYAELDTC